MIKEGCAPERPPSRQVVIASAGQGLVHARVERSETRRELETSARSHLAKRGGAPGRTRTFDPRLRRPMRYAGGGPGVSAVGAADMPGACGTTRPSRITKIVSARPGAPGVARDQHASLSRYRICRREFVPSRVHSNIPPDSEDREHRIAVCRMDARAMTNGRRHVWLGMLLLTVSACSHRIQPAPPPQAPARVSRGVAAADPAVLPFGSVIRVTGAASYDGTYRVLDTGALVRRRHVDLYIPDCPAARRFGRRSVQVEVIRTRQ